MHFLSKEGFQPMVSNPSREGLQWTFSLEKGLNPWFKTIVSNPSTKGFEPIRMFFLINFTFLKNVSLLKSRFNHYRMFLYMYLYKNSMRTLCFTHFFDLGLLIGAIGIF